MGNDQDIEKKIEEKSKNYTKSDLEKAIKFEDQAKKKYSKVPGKFKKLVNQIKLMFMVLKSYRKGSYKEIPWSSVGAIIFAVIYFVSPIDIVPDFIMLAGYLDDAYVVQFVLKLIQADLKKYIKLNSLNESDYF